MLAIACSLVGTWNGASGETAVQHFGTSRNVRRPIDTELTV
jgi:hypothetical protein